jgi:hypothetical protein
VAVSEDAHSSITNTLRISEMDRWSFGPRITG